MLTFAYILISSLVANDLITWLRLTIAIAGVAVVMTMLPLAVQAASARNAAVASGGGLFAHASLTVTILQRHLRLIVATSRPTHLAGYQTESVNENNSNRDAIASE